MILFYQLYNEARQLPRAFLVAIANRIIWMLERLGS